MRKLTITELEAELQVGTVDMSDVELVLPLDQSIDDFMVAAENLPTTVREDLLPMARPFDLGAMLLDTAKIPVAMKAPDTRAALAVADADAAASAE